MAPQDLYGLPGAGGAGQIITLKKGSGLGNYTTTSTTFVRVDTTNLVYAVVVPIGQKLQIAIAAALNNASGIWDLALADGTADNTGIIVFNEGSINGAILPFSLLWVVVGDGALHTFNLQYRTTSGTLNLLNLSATNVPVMMFTLGVAS